MLFFINSCVALSLSLNKATNIQINNIHSTNSLSIIKALSRIEKYDIIVIGSDIYKKGECAGSLLVDKFAIRHY